MRAQPFLLSVVRDTVQNRRRHVSALVHCRLILWAQAFLVNILRESVWSRRGVQAEWPYEQAHLSSRPQVFHVVVPRVWNEHVF